MSLDSIILLTAIAGYGDPVDGFPSAEERALVLWTNAARVAPTEHTGDYRSGGCSPDDFSSDEKKPQKPLYLDLGLTEAARYHSDDMRKNGCFQHESCDGTDTWARIGRYYNDGSYLGENIAYGSADPKYTVLSMWMCSTSGHRANIMTGDYNEMGGGVSKDYMTQDFAAGNLDMGEPPVRTAAEYGEGFYADWGDTDGPADLALYIGDKKLGLEKVYGEADNGIYFVKASAGKCDPWFVAWETKDGNAGTFPATGAFLGGGCQEEYDGESSVGGDGDGGFSDDGDEDNGGESDNPYAVDGLDSVNVVCGTGAGGVGALLSVLAAGLGFFRRAKRS